MNNLNNKIKIKNFLLKHKKIFQECLTKHIVANCFFCPMREVQAMMPNCNNYNCTKVYEYIAILFDKEPKKSIIRTDALCKDVRKEMIKLISSINNALEIE